jgi:hypothetical protein
MAGRCSEPHRSRAKSICLNTDTATILHARLSASIRLGYRWTYTLDRLVELVWGEAGTGATCRWRRARVRHALSAMARVPGSSANFNAPVCNYLILRCKMRLKSPILLSRILRHRRWPSHLVVLEPARAG